MDTRYVVTPWWNQCIQLQVKKEVFKVAAMKYEPRTVTNESLHRMFDRMNSNCEKLSQFDGNRILLIIKAQNINSQQEIPLLADISIIWIIVLNIFEIFQLYWNSWIQLTLLTSRAFPTRRTKALKANAFSRPIFMAAAAIIMPIPLFFFFLASPLSVDSSGFREKPRVIAPSLSEFPVMTTSVPSKA